MPQLSRRAHYLTVAVTNERTNERVNVRLAREQCPTTFNCRLAGRHYGVSSSAPLRLTADSSRAPHPRSTPPTVGPNCRRRSPGAPAFPPPQCWSVPGALPPRIRLLMRRCGLGDRRRRPPLSRLSAVIIYCARGAFLSDSARDKRSPAVADDRPGTRCRRAESR